MVLTRSDQAKYPFIQNASEEVKREDLVIGNLENPELQSILDRAQNRIEESLENNPPVVKYRPHEEDTEVPSFPVAIILAAASDNEYLKRRYALAEARRTYELLMDEDKNKILEIAKVFNWRIRKPIGETICGRKFDFALFFIDFLRNSRQFHEDSWKLINHILFKGEVYLQKREVVRLLQEEVQRHIQKRLNIDVKSMIPEIVLERINKLKLKYSRHLKKTEFIEFPKEIVNKDFSPCMIHLYAEAKSGHHLSHLARFALTSFLINIGMKPDDVIDLFHTSSDYNERIARYQVEHIAGSRGSRTKYIPPTCKTLKTHSLCPISDDLCKNIRHPLIYYKKKIRMLKK